MSDDLIHLIALKDNRIYDLQKALEWYAQGNHVDMINFKVRDTGERARKALQSIQGGDRNEL